MVASFWCEEEVYFSLYHGAYYEKKYLQQITTKNTANLSHYINKNN